MIGRGRAELRRQQCATRVPELVGMHAQRQAELHRGVQHLARFFGRERAAIAEHVAVVGETCFDVPEAGALKYIAGYAIANFRLGFRGDSGWDVYGWVRNAFDKQYYEVLATTPGNTGLISGQPADPRTFGVTLRVDF